MKRWKDLKRENARLEGPPGKLTCRGAEMPYIKPERVWEAAYQVMSDSRLRDESLGGVSELLEAESKALPEGHRLEYRRHCPHGTQGNQISAEFALDCR